MVSTDCLMIVVCQSGCCWGFFFYLFDGSSTRHLQLGSIFRIWFIKQCFFYANDLYHGSQLNWVQSQPWTIFSNGYHYYVIFNRLYSSHIRGKKRERKKHHDAWTLLFTTISLQLFTISMESVIAFGRWSKWWTDNINQRE